MQDLYPVFQTANHLDSYPFNFARADQSTLIFTLLLLTLLSAPPLSWPLGQR